MKNNCCNSELIETPQTFKNGVIHIRLTCKKCEKFQGWKPQPLKEEYILHFGKHKGKLLKNVDKEYLAWLKNQDIKKNLKDKIEEIILNQVNCPNPL